MALTLGTGAAGAAGPAATTTTGSTTTAGTTTAVSKPNNTQPPTITGTPEEGQKLVGHRGTWTGKPTDYNDRWVRCDKNGASCANISGATNRNGYVLTSADVGNTIRFKVEAKNAGGSTFASSAPTAVIKAASSTPPPASNGCPSKKIDSNAVSSISPPARLLIDQTEINPSNVTYSTNSITLRFHVSACGGSVAGALVYATAVPVQPVLDPERADDGREWLGDAADEPPRRLPREQQAAAARDVRPRTQARRAPAERNLNPPPRLLPRHSLGTRSATDRRA